MRERGERTCCSISIRWYFACAIVFVGRESTKLPADFWPRRTRPADHEVAVDDDISCDRSQLTATRKQPRLYLADGPRSSWGLRLFFWIACSRESAQAARDSVRFLAPPWQFVSIIACNDWLIYSVSPFTFSHVSFTLTAANDIFIRFSSSCEVWVGVRKIAGRRRKRDKEANLLYSIHLYYIYVFYRHVLLYSIRLN